MTLDPKAEQELFYRPNEYDDWGVIRSKDGMVFASVRRPLDEEEASKHRAAKTDPFEPLARSLIAALSKEVQASEAVGVKPLEWYDKAYAAQVVVAQLGLTYTLMDGRDGWFAAVSGAGISEYLPGNFPTRDEAKAVAQADFETRIGAFLATPQPLPATNMWAVMEVVAWQTMDSAPKDGSEFVAIESWESGKKYARLYRWEGPPNYWSATNGEGVCIRPEYQERYRWASIYATQPLPATNRGAITEAKLSIDELIGMHQTILSAISANELHIYYTEFQPWSIVLLRAMRVIDDLSRALSVPAPGTGEAERPVIFMDERGNVTTTDGQAVKAMFEAIGPARVGSKLLPLVPALSPSTPVGEGKQP